MITINTIEEFENYKNNFIDKDTQDYTSYKFARNEVNFSEEFLEAFRKEQEKGTIELKFYELETKNFETTRDKIIKKLLEHEELNEVSYEVDFIIKTKKFEKHLKKELKRFYEIIKNSTSSLSKKEREEMISKINVENIFYRFLEK